MNIELKTFSGLTAGDVRYIEAFTIPQLNRTRKIWIYLPPEYSQGENKFPVIYMHDGQNLFSPDTAYSGHWAVSDSLERLCSDGKTRGAIVVGIESDAHRETELVTLTDDCERYLQFIVTTLKPYIDSNFRVLPWRESTAIMGSSYGGQTAIFAALKHPEIFGLVGAFSPSWHVTAAVVAEYAKQYPIKYFICAGAVEGEWVARNILRNYTPGFTPNYKLVAQALEAQGQEVRLDVDDYGAHIEQYWARKFPQAYQYLFPTNK